MKAYVSFVQDPVDPGPRRLPGDRWAPLLADLEAAAAAAPESPGYYFGIAVVRLISGDRAASSDALRELIDRYGDNSDYLLISTSWLCGMSPDADIDRERLVRALRRARESNPSWPSVIARVQLADPLGVALLRAGRFAEAIERLEAFDAHAASSTAPAPGSPRSGRTHSTPPGRSHAVPSPSTGWSGGCCSARPRSSSGALLPPGVRPGGPEGIARGVRA
jgi:hypothetical protein